MHDSPRLKSAQMSLTPTFQHQSLSPELPQKSPDSPHDSRFTPSCTRLNCADARFPTTFSLNHYLLLMCSRHLSKYVPDNIQSTHIGKTSILNITINPAQTLTRSPTGAVGRDPIRLMLHATISSTPALQSLLPDHSLAPHQSLI